MSTPAKLELPEFLTAEELLALEDAPEWLTPRLKQAGYTAERIAWDAAEHDREPAYWARVLASIFYEESDKVIKRHPTPLLTCDDA